MPALQDVLACLLDTLNIKFIRLDGSVQVSERMELIDSFNADPDISVFLLTTRAGGLGLNLTAADTCIIHDVDFNPAMDQQAEDRCHRIGQKKNVTIYRLICKGTVDEGIYRLSEKKKLANELILNDNQNGRSDSGNNSSSDNKDISKLVSDAFKKFNDQKKNGKDESTVVASIADSVAVSAPVEPSVPLAAAEGEPTTNSAHVAGIADTAAVSMQVEPSVPRAAAKDEPTTISPRAHVAATECDEDEIVELETQYKPIETLPVVYDVPPKESDKDEVIELEPQDRPMKASPDARVAVKKPDEDEIIILD